MRTCANLCWSRYLRHGCNEMLLHGWNVPLDVLMEGLMGVRWQKVGSFGDGVNERKFNHS
eukprot:scaffold867_cov317-Pavlova_lutheri.AAC.32